jgi:predicted ribosome quality control (RQC) complex YloA/Tae2 family protein
MKITISLNKSVQANATKYFEESKKSKKKLEGANKALIHSKLKLKKLEEGQLKQREKVEQQKQKVKRKKDWYEKFRWFYTSKGNLFIAGRDSTTNEIVIKKHTDNDDLIFHTEMAGSPFGVLKTKDRDKQELEECATFIACYSKTWKLGLTAMDVFYVTKDQVTKEAPSGEFIQKGSFMIYGKKTMLSVSLDLNIGKMKDGKVMSGPLSAVKKHCEVSVKIIQGNEKTSAVAKKINHKIKADDLDDLVKVIPVGSKVSK